MAAKPSRPAEHSHIEGQLSFLDAASEGTAPSPETIHEGAVPLAEVKASEPAAARAPQPDPGTADAAADADTSVITGPNTRVRAGNAMERARAGAIRGAIETLARRGLKRLTMAEAADRGGLARATLYNHVRDKDALIALLLEHETQAVAEAFVLASGVEQGLVAAAQRVAEHPALAGLRQHDPSALVLLQAPPSAALRELASTALASRGLPSGAAQVDLVLRWLASFVASPSDPATRAEQAATLARTLH